MAPPVESSFIDETPSKWPTVIGVISIVLASLGLLCGCAGYFQVPLQRWGLKMQSQSGQPDPLAEAQIKIAEQYQMLTIILLTIGMVITLWLLVASIALVRRRRSARGQMIGWAVASILMLAINVVFQVLMFQATADELRQMGEAQSIGRLWIGVAITAFFVLVFGLALQLFVLIWFSRRKVREEMASWR